MKLANVKYDQSIARRQIEINHRARGYLNYARQIMMRAREKLHALNRRWSSEGKNDRRRTTKGEGTVEESACKMSQ